MESRCLSYDPGHLTSHEKGREMARARETAIDRQVAEVRPDGTVILNLDGSSVVLWHHDTEAIKRLTEGRDPEASFNPEQSSLFVRPSKPHAGWQGFHMAVEGTTHTSCVSSFDRPE